MEYMENVKYRWDLAQISTKQKFIISSHNTLDFLQNMVYNIVSTQKVRVLILWSQQRIGIITGAIAFVFMKGRIIYDNQTAF